MGESGTRDGTDALPSTFIKHIDMSEFRCFGTELTRYFGIRTQDTPAEMAEGQNTELQSSGGSGVAQGEQTGTWHGLFAKVAINGVFVEAMIDTGSSYSFMARRIYDSVDSSSRPPLRPLTEPMMMADGSLLRMYGRTTVSLQLGLYLLQPSDFIVADIRHEAILGLDFLRGSRSVIDCYRHKLHTPCGIHECHPRLDEGPIWAQQETGCGNCWCLKFCD